MPTPIKVVLITGGSSGLGKAMCERLATKGHSVYGTGRSVTGITPEGGYHLIGMDVTEEASVAHAVAEVLLREGRIDVLVNNAGLGIQGPAEDISVETAQQLFNTNLFGPHRMCRAVLPLMRKAKSGLIINISSVGSNFGLPYRSFYSASKAALVRYGESLAIELEPFNISVVTVQPGEFNTNTANVRLQPEVISDAYRKRFDRAMEVLSGSMRYSRDPDHLALVVERIISSSKPGTSYVVAKGLQRLSILAKRLLPGRTFQRLLGKHFE